MKINTLVNKMRKILSRIIIIALIITGCIKKNQSNDSNSFAVHEVKIENAISNHSSIKRSFLSFIDTIKYIPLETNSNSLIENVQKVIYYENNFYVWDYNRILKFDIKGKFICQIGNKGKGPGEYIQNRGIIIHSDTLFLNSGNRILAYNTKSGSYLKTFPFKSRMFFEKIGNNFVTMNEYNGFLEFFSYKGSPLDSINYEKYSKKIYNGGFVYPMFNIFFKANASIYISTSHNDTIFEINKAHKLIPAFVLNMGKYKLQDKKRFEYIGSFDVFDKITLNCIRPVPLETSRYLILQLGKWGTVSNFSSLGWTDKKTDLIGLGVFDKQNNQFYLIKEDTVNLPGFYPNFSDDKNSLLSFVNSSEAIEFLNRNSGKNLSRQFINSVKNVKTGDNPIIIIATMKLNDKLKK